MTIDHLPKISTMSNVQFPLGSTGVDWIHLSIGRWAHLVSETDGFTRFENGDLATGFLCTRCSTRPHTILVKLWKDVGQPEIPTNPLCLVVCSSRLLSTNGSGATCRAVSSSSCQCDFAHAVTTEGKNQKKKEKKQNNRPEKKNPNNKHNKCFKAR